MVWLIKQNKVRQKQIGRERDRTTQVFTVYAFKKAMEETYIVVRAVGVAQHTAGTQEWAHWWDLGE